MKIKYQKLEYLFLISYQPPPPLSVAADGFKVDVEDPPVLLLFNGDDNRSFSDDTVDC